MRTTRERDLCTGITAVRLAGELNRNTVTTVRAAIDKAAAECPAAVLVDLSELTRIGPAMVSVFGTATYRAQEWWGVPVLLHGAPPETRRQLSSFRSFVTVYETETQALAALYHTRFPRWASRRVAPVPEGPAAARALLDEVCQAWSLPRLRDPARLIAGELATNAVLHAGTDFDVTAGLTRRYLRIGVRDGTGADAGLVAGPGRGLGAVEAFSTGWGVIRVPDGKVVWAMIVAPAAEPELRG
jgi:anti-anti-sigma regulatory factor